MCVIHFKAEHLLGGVIHTVKSHSAITVALVQSKYLDQTANKLILVRIIQFFTVNIVAS